MFDSLNQQDAHEFLMYLLNEISDSLEKEEKQMIKRLKLESEMSKQKKEVGGRGGEKEDTKMGRKPNATTSTMQQQECDIVGQERILKEEEEESSGSSEKQSKVNSSTIDASTTSSSSSSTSSTTSSSPSPSSTSTPLKQNLSFISSSSQHQPSISSSVKTFVQSIFQGTLTNETRCLTCESVTSRDENFLDVQLDVEQNCSITHCLSRFSKVERLTGTNKFSCECCGALQEAEKRMKFKNLPKILVLHLKRFKYLENPGAHAKLSHRVTFPIELRIPSYSPQHMSIPLGSGGAAAVQQQVGGGSVGGANVGSGISGGGANGSSNGGSNSISSSVPLSSLNDSSSPPSSHDDEPIYYLSSMVAHIGPSAQSGHYVSFIRSGDKWLSMDDHRVNPVIDTELLMNRAFGCWNHNPEEPQNSASAYILFYEHRPQVGLSSDST
jgi:ubiquitin C-terminal hydrolase